MRPSSVKRMWIVTYSAPSHCLDQCWRIFNYIFGNKSNWKPNKKQQFSQKKFSLKIWSAQWQLFCLGVSVLRCHVLLMVLFYQHNVHGLHNNSHSCCPLNELLNGTSKLNNNIALNQVFVFRIINNCIHRILHRDDVITWNRFPQYWTPSH